MSPFLKRVNDLVREGLSTHEIEIKLILLPHTIRSRKSRYNSVKRGEDALRWLLKKKDKNAHGKR
jgi:hypothetical protein